MKKFYEKAQLGLDFDSVLAFNLSFMGDNGSVYGKELVIIIGGKFGEPSRLTFPYERYSFIGGESVTDYNLGKEIYDDLVEFFTPNDKFETTGPK